jgi:glycosyltransferase involved in cell wall biosynthesis
LLLKNVKLVIVGEGPDRTRLERLADSRIEFKGRIKDEELDKTYRNCDVVLFPALAEPFGLVPIEAMKRGKPIICSKEAGVAEVVKQAEAGIIVDPLNIEQIANSILLLKRKPELRRKFGLKGKKFVKDLSKKCVLEFERVLKEAVGMGW